MANTMAFWTRDSTPDLPTAAPSNHKELADQTGSIASQTMSTPCRFFRMIISLKTYALGSDTIGPTFRLRGANNSAMTTNLTIMGGTIAQLVASATAPQSFAVGGYAPVVAFSFVDMTVVFSGTGTATFDCILDAD